MKPAARRPLQRSRPRRSPHLARLALLLVAAAAGGAVVGATEEVAPAAASPREVGFVTIDSIIHPVAAEHLVEALRWADRTRLEALVVRLDTPGGLLDSTREMFEAMMAADTPVVLWVGPAGARAASAGFFLLMAADVAVMAPGTNTGAAHPVGAQGGDIPGHLGEKAEQDSAATIRSLAERHGRAVEKAEAAVMESRSYTADEALAAGLVDFLAPSREELVRLLDGRVVKKGDREPRTLATREARVLEREMSVLRRVLSAIVHPEIAYLLFGLGMLGLWGEITHPGTLFPGIVGVICLLLAFYAMSVLPVSYAGVGLLILAFGLFVAETQVVSHGLLALGGVVSLVLGSLLLFRDAEPALRVGMSVIATVAGTISIIIGLLLWRLVRVQRSPVKTGAEGLLGELGVVRQALGPRGKVFVHGELWNAESETPVEAGARIEVVGVDGLRLRVRPIGTSPLA